MKRIQTTATVPICGTRNAASLSPSKNTSPKAAETNVVLEIQCDRRNGYNLVMSPEGYFTADFHYKTESDAKAAAEELFDMSPSEWIEVESG